ncbi:SET domain-containing protein SmydA-8-like [Choristoneura fumiferana]|uniref:SET domain-containing protein SmydA-8-like n=1 Tax=Choristoneura fumiferana TaxID=7141 RepID=UPI003D153A23
MKSLGSCYICLAPSSQKCSGCQAVHYCSREHQKQHWKQHKHQCTPVKVKEDETVGRYLEASRVIKAGDIVMKEKALITGPAQVTPPVCLGCYKLLEAGKTVDCELCGWPFCSQDCTLKEDHTPECHYTEKRGEKVSIPSSAFGSPHPNYQCITVLRCLYQRDHDKKLWEKLYALQSHCEDRRGTDKWQNDRKMIAEFIWKFFKLEGVFSEEEVMRCCGIIQVNGHEVPLLEPEYVSVFDRISMVEHNCRANCNKSFTSDGQIILCAGADIGVGQHVTVCYSDPLWGTEARRHHLADSKFFECTCARCADPTELGTMFSAVKCKKKNCKGYLLPETFIIPILHKTKNPNPETRNLDNKSWVCNSCKDAVSDAIIQQLLQDIGRELSIMPKGDPDACERFINHCSNYLHPRHYYLTDVSLALAQIIGQESELGLAAISDDRLLLKMQLCRSINDLLETLAPAETRLRGSLLFELHAAVAETGRRKSLTDGPGVMLGYVTESRRILLQSVALLRHEPPELPEGRVAQQARANIVHMDELIKNLAANLPAPL